MCGRYLIDDEAFDLREILEAAEKNIQSMNVETASPVWQKTGSIEVFPGTYAPVIDANHEAVFMLWGFPNIMTGNQPHINARSETASVKRTFSGAMASRRCLVPASGYYEWKATGKRYKDKYEFKLPENTTMYMAGIYSQDGRYAILTRAASPTIAEVHDRMPVILPEPYHNIWLNETPEVINEALTELHHQLAPGVNQPQQLSMFS